LRHHELLLQFIWWETQEKYRRTTFGIVWLLLNPFLKLIVYTTVFSFLLGGKNMVWGMESDVNVGLMIFSGLIIFNVFAETVSSAPRLMWANRSYVKHIPFPIEILPITMAGASLLQAFFGVVILLGMKYFFVGHIGWSCLYLPLVFFPLIPFTVGLSWIFSTIGVFWLDINNITQSFIQFMLFLSAIVFPLDRIIAVLPSSAALLFRINPLMTIVEDARRVTLRDLPPDWHWYIITLIGSYVFMTLGYAVFMRTKRAFSDVI
jgi:lipopolysaccharide transport system permease protein